LKNIFISCIIQLIMPEDNRAAGVYSSLVKNEKACKVRIRIIIFWDEDEQWMNA